MAPGRKWTPVGGASGAREPGQAHGHGTDSGAPGSQLSALRAPALGAHPVGMADVAPRPPGHRGTDDQLAAAARAGLTRRSKLGNDDGRRYVTRRLSSRPGLRQEPGSAGRQRRRGLLSLPHHVEILDLQARSGGHHAGIRRPSAGDPAGIGSGYDRDRDSACRSSASRPSETRRIIARLARCVAWWPRMLSLPGAEMLRAANMTAIAAGLVPPSARSSISWRHGCVHVRHLTSATGQHACQSSSGRLGPGAKLTWFRLSPCCRPRGLGVTNCRKPVRQRQLTGLRLTSGNHKGNLDCGRISDPARAGPSPRGRPP